MFDHEGFIARATKNEQDWVANPEKVKVIEARLVRFTTEDKHKYIAMLMPRDGNDRIFIPITNGKNGSLLRTIGLRNYKEIEHKADKLNFVIQALDLAHGAIKRGIITEAGMIDDVYGIQMTMVDKFESPTELVRSLKERLSDTKVEPVRIRS